MSQFPQTLDVVLEQAKTATKTALEAGIGRIQVEVLVPEIALQAQAIAFDFLPLFESYGAGLKVLFPDTGAAALAQRDWGGEITARVSDLGSRRTSVEMKISPEDEVFLVVCPSAVEVPQVEKLCELAGDRPVVILLPQLEDVAIVGIGLAARKIRERFLSTLESAYYYRPLEGAGVLRCYPGPWQVWQDTEEGYKLVAEEAVKPMGEALDMMLKQRQAEESDKAAPASRGKGILGELQQFLRALSQ